ncbi:MAG: ATP-binding protein [Clostridia bacterium]|nr:ATP-binding protein [Clostridia bacterium]
MFELALHILDLVQNSVTAKASLVIVEVRYEGEWLAISIIDDGCGMSEEMLARAQSPFGTSRTTRRVGLGIPMFKQLSLMCEGEFSINSAPGEGTTLVATFRAANVDLPPMGDLSGTIKALIVGAPEKPDFVLRYERDGEQFEFDTRQIREQLDGVPLNEPDVLAWIGEYIDEGIKQIDAV